MPRIVVTAEMWQVLAPIAGALSHALPSQFEGFRVVASVAAADAEALYKSYLSGADIPGHGALKGPSKCVRTAYRREAGMLQWAVGNSSPAAEGIEEGTPARDMKKCLPTAPRARQTPDGTKYLIIPFRHANSEAKTNSAGLTATGMRAMPKRVYAMAVEMERSMRVGTATTRESATGYTVPAWRYEWNGRLAAADLEGAGLSEEDGRNYEGMVKMGVAGHSSYMTFRVMSQKSNPESWWQKAKDGVPALATAIQEAMSIHQGALSAAFVSDLQAIAHK